MARLLPQGTVNNLRSLDLLITSIVLNFTHVLLEYLINGPAVRMPEHHTRRFFLQVEQIQLLRQFTVVALLSLFKTLEIRFHFFFVVPRSTVDTLQLSVLRISTPVGARHTLQLEDTHNTSIRYVRTTTHICVFFMVIQANRLFTFFDQIVDQLNFVVFTTINKHAACVFDRRHLLDDFVILLDQLFNTLLDGFEVFGCKWTLVINIVIEAVFDHRANGHLSRWVQLLNGMTNEVSE